MKLYEKAFIVEIVGIGIFLLMYAGYLIFSAI